MAARWSLEGFAEEVAVLLELGDQVALEAVDHLLVDLFGVLCLLGRRPERLADLADRARRRARGRLDRARRGAGALADEALHRAGALAERVRRRAGGRA